MDYQLIANILLAVSSFFSLAVMLRWDLLMLRENEYSNKQFMAWLQDSDESYSSKRIVPMAALVACATPWARESWMVVGIIAVAMVALATALLASKRKQLLQCNKRATAIILMVLAIVGVCAISLFASRYSLEAGMMLLLFTAFSYVLVLGANGIIDLFNKKK
ncbi:MAG: hypothetical protein IJM66_10450 [Muribaculaceae bacterium]|nr:hypothetical protein [Muribaculaceae bacterium]MBQ6649253.1 hypothetical protein [Muribaculaceae bacterium]